MELVLKKVASRQKTALINSKRLYSIDIKKYLNHQ